MAAKFNDAFVAYFSDVVADLRSKLVDEGWFQRQSTEPHFDRGLHDTLDPDGIGERDFQDRPEAEWRSAFRAEPNRQDNGPDFYGNDHEHGIDR